MVMSSPATVGYETLTKPVVNKFGLPGVYIQDEMNTPKPTRGDKETTAKFMNRVFKESMERELIGCKTQESTWRIPHALRKSLEDATGCVGGYVENVTTQCSPSSLSTTSATVRLPVFDDSIINEVRVNILSSPHMRDGDYFHVPERNTIAPRASLWNTSSTSITIDEPTFSTVSGHWNSFDVIATTPYTGSTIKIEFNDELFSSQYQNQWKSSEETFVDELKRKFDQRQRVIKEAIRGNLKVIDLGRKPKINHNNVSPQEEKARQTLRDMISEKEWRRYITNGFIMVPGKSGKFYQIFADRSHTIVWEHNKKINELCIVAADNCPKTDHVITIKVMVELDEESVWKGSNIHQPRGKPTRPNRNNGNLIDKVARIA